MGGKKSKEAEVKSRITEQDRAVLQLKQMRDKLKQYKNKIEIQMEKDREAARGYLKNGQTEKAKALLKKKKFYETNLDRTEGQLDNIEQLTHNLEFTQVEHQVVNSLKTGNDCLKKLHQMMSLDEIEQIMDDTREGIEHQRKIDELISGEFSSEDMDDINAELDEIVASTLKLPDVPNNNLNINEKIRNDKIEETSAKREKQKKIAVSAE